MYCRAAQVTDTQRRLAPQIAKRPETKVGCRSRLITYHTNGVTPSSRTGQRPHVGPDPTVPGSFVGSTVLTARCHFLCHTGYRSPYCFSASFLIIVIVFCYCCAILPLWAFFSTGWYAGQSAPNAALQHRKQSKTNKRKEGKAGAKRTEMSPAQIYSSQNAAQDASRGACFVAWPADEPYSEPTLLVAHPPQPRCYPSTANMGGNGTAPSGIQQSASCPSLASDTSVSQDASSEKSMAVTTESRRSSCHVLL